MPFTLETGSKKERFVTLQPDSLRGIYRDVPLVNPDITPATISTVWHPKLLSSLGQQVKGSRVFLHFHGGAFVFDVCRDSDVACCCGTSSIIRIFGAIPTVSPCLLPG